MTTKKSESSRVPESLRQYSVAELEALKSVIDYAERMIYDDRQGYPYTSLRRQAYAKTVVIESRTLGRQEFRISATPAVITPNRVGYATPHSPVGRLGTHLKVGDRGESPAWGNYRVVETRLFQRFDGVEFERNVRNFLRMEVLGQRVAGDVTDLQAFVRPPPTPSFPTEPTAQERLQGGSIPSGKGAGLQSAPADLVRFEGVDEGVGPTADEFDDRDVDPESVRPRSGNYFGLNEIFYVDRTQEQDQIIARSPVGPMFVEGVAGSGKTSAALGRTKMLCDFDARNVVSKQEFESIVGSEAVHWDERFAGQFSQESSVGFVRTGELIQYLKETCRRIDLPNLPVLEFKELRTRLRDHRQILRRGGGGARWSGASDVRATTIDTTMQWLFGADRAVALIVADQLIGRLPTAEDFLDVFEIDRRAAVRRIADEAVRHVRNKVYEIAESLRSLDSARPAFALEAIASRLLQAIQETRREVLGRSVVWVVTGGRSFNAVNERRLSQLLIDAKVALYLRSGARLVWLSASGPVDSALQFVDSMGAKVTWSTDTSRDLEAGRVLVQDIDGRKFPGRAYSLDDLYLALLPEAVEGLYFEERNALKRLRIERGLGRVRFPLIGDSTKLADLAPDEVEQAASPDVIQAPPKFRTVDAAFAALMRRRMLGPFLDLASLYRLGLAKYEERFPDPTTSRAVQQQLESGVLGEADVDLLLCLYQVVGRGLTRGAPAALVEPPFFQSVFVDEVQDFSEQQVFLMAEQANPEYRAVTVVGDLAQKLHSGESIDVLACFPSRSIDYVRLSENLRQSKAPHLALFSACYRSVLHDKGVIPSSIVTGAVASPSVGGPKVVAAASSEDVDARILEDLDDVGPNETAAVVFPTLDLARNTHKRLKDSLARQMIEADLSSKVDLSRRFVRHFTSIEHVKGLEFDVVIVCDADKYDLTRPIDRNRLYVAITRPRRRLTLVHRTDSFSAGLRAVLERYSEITKARGP